MSYYELNFKKDLVIGEEGERFVTSFLCERYQGEKISENKTYTHDVVIAFPVTHHPLWSGVKTLEIKTDVYKRDTGNMFVEYTSRGKLSGISVSKADIFLTYFKNLNEMWAIKTKELRRLIMNNDFRKVTNAGDTSSRNSGFLIPRIKYADHFITYKINQ
jgi:hypothetical protein